MNKESMLLDPINWSRLSDSLLENFKDVTISKQTDSIFRERTPLAHGPRVLPKETSLKTNCRLYSFYDADCPIDTTKAKNLHVPPAIAKLIDKANQHNPCLSVLGILPNRLRRVLKVSRHPDPEAALTDLSRTLFFSGFRVWSKRQVLAAQYWKSVAPENQHANISGRKRKNVNSEEKAAQTNCKYPLHFLKRHANFSQQRRLSLLSC